MGQVLLNDGVIAQPIVVLAQDGRNTNLTSIFQQELIGHQNTPYPEHWQYFTFGRRTDIGDTPVDLWEGPTAQYVFPSSPMRMQLVSTSTSDAAAGAGVRQVRIYYLDADWAQQHEDVTLNGLTPVLTVATNIRRVNGMHAIAVGSAGVTAGNIELQAVGGAVTYSHMRAGCNTARQGVYSVPAGMVGYISHWQNSSGSTGAHFCRITINATTQHGQVFPGVFLVQDENGTQNSGGSINLPIPIPLPPMTDVKLSAVGDAQNAAIIAMGSIMGWFEPVTT